MTASRAAYSCGRVVYGGAERNERFREGIVLADGAVAEQAEIAGRHGDCLQHVGGERIAAAGAGE